MDQVKVLASAVRNRVYWSFTAEEPISASDVSRDLGKSAQTIHYHVNELLRVGLIIPVSTRKRHARLEKLFVRTGVQVRDMGEDGTPEYNFYRQKAFAAMMRTITRESAMMYELMEHEKSVHDFSAYLRVVKRLSRSQADSFRKRMADLLIEISQSKASPEEPQVHVVMCMRPSTAQSRHWADEWNVEVGKMEPDVIDAEE
ncbi:MAG: helix-turn-helix transcriptional regulator [Fimbriimonadaceae bacterium]|nr:helix-turn-helix transcriptional regulator [Fimbriimonadaceae bacterium]